MSDELRTELEALRARLAEQQDLISRLEREAGLTDRRPRRRRSLRAGVVLALVAAFALVPALALAAVAFSDVSSSNPYSADIQAVAGKGVMTGCGSGKFCPTAYVTNQQLARYLNRLGALTSGATPVANAARLAGHSGTYYASAGYATSFSTEVTMEAAGTSHKLMSITVPTGVYIVTARLQGRTGTDGGGNNFRYDCTLQGADAVIDDPVYRVGETNSVENYLTYEGRYSGAGPITLTCRSANGHTLYAVSGVLTAVKVTQ